MNNSAVLGTLNEVGYLGKDQTYSLRTTMNERNDNTSVITFVTTSSLSVVTYRRETTLTKKAGISVYYLPINTLSEITSNEIGHRLRVEQTK